jgi:hypothetical protein
MGRFISLIFASVLAFGCAGVASARPMSSGEGLTTSLSQSTVDVEPTSVSATDVKTRAETSSEVGVSIDPDAYEFIEPADWRVVQLSMQLSHGGQCDVTLLRPLAWFDAHSIDDGGSVFLNLPEMGVRGDAEVVRVDACPETVGPSQPGARPITGTFVTTNAAVVDLFVDGVAAPIGVTASHPFWSEDRAAWVAVGDLTPGERLRSLAGDVVVSRIEPRSEPETVYNIEVHRGHTYYITDTELWVHNAYACKLKGFDVVWEKHGPHKAYELIRKASSGTAPPQGWFSVQPARLEAWIFEQMPSLGNGAKTLIAPGLWGRVAMPDGRIEMTNRIRLVPSGAGVKTAYPVPMQ